MEPRQQHPARQGDEAAQLEKPGRSDDSVQGAVEEETHHQPEAVGQGVVHRLAQGLGGGGDEAIDVEDARHVKDPVGQRVQPLGEEDPDGSGRPPQDRPAQDGRGEGQPDGPFQGDAAEKGI